MRRAVVIYGMFGVLLVVAMTVAVTGLMSHKDTVTKDATNIGDYLVDRHAKGHGFPDEVTGDNADGSSPQVHVDGAASKHRLSAGVRVGYFSAEGDLDFALCLEYLDERGVEDAFAVYSTGGPENGAISQAGDGAGCSGAE